MMSRTLNYIKSPKDTRDYALKFSGINSSLPPSSIDLSEYCTSVKDQGQEGSCTAFSTIAAMEFLEKKFNSNPMSNFSEQFTYYVTRVDIARGPPSQDSGAYVRDSIKSTISYGTCFENTWPYSNPLNRKPSTQAYLEAKKYGTISYTTIQANNLNLLKTTLSQGIPVVIGFICYSNIFDSGVSTTGIIPLQNDNIIGGHAVLLVGYNDTTGQFKFKNSWGTSWGDNGYGYLPYEYYTEGDIPELWCILTKADNTKLIGVGVSVNNQTLLNTQLTSVLNDVVNNMNTARNKTSYISYFNGLLSQYPTSNTKVRNFINSLRNSFQVVNS
jgi:C1A family cysteine protease